MLVHRHLTAVVLVVVVFAQFVTALHACPGLGASSASTAIAAVEQPMPADCPALDHQSVATVNVCVLHCFAPAQLDGHFDPPGAVPAIQTPLIVAVVDELAGSFAAWDRHAVTAVDPPPLVRFSRLRI